VQPVSARPFIVGLTGGIGSGKSAAADIFGELGAAIVDTDRIAHLLTASGGAAMAAISAAFGDGVLTEEGALNRPAMRALAFEDPAARKRLEAILHPMIRQRKRASVPFAPSAPYVMLAVPLAGRVRHLPGAGAAPVRRGLPRGGPGGPGHAAQCPG
jgi:dephospho-CoA kinase